MPWADIETRRRYNKKYQAEHREEIRANRRAWYLKNKEHVWKKSQLYRKNHPGYRIGEKKKYKLRHPHRVWCQHTLYSHKERGFTVNIKSLELENKVKNITHCSYCGNKLIWSRRKKSYVLPFSPTLDRINNEKIMNINNVEIICHRCNTAKGAGTREEFLKYCEQVIKNLKRRKR